MLSVDEIVLAETGRSEPSFEDLYRQHAPAVSRWVKRLWGRHDADDVLHEVFLVVQRRLPEFRGDASLGTWLYAITVRVVSSRRRQEKLRRLLFLRATPELQQQRSELPTPLGSVLRDQTASRVYAVLDRLSERDRTLLILFELEGLSVAQIKDIVSMSEENVWVSLHRARARFRKTYWKRYGRELGV